MSENSLFGRMDPKTGAPLSWTPSVSVRTAGFISGVTKFLTQTTDSLFKGMGAASALGATQASAFRTQVQPILVNLANLAATVGQIASYPAAFGSKRGQEVLDRSTEVMHRSYEADERMGKVAKDLGELSSYSSKLREAGVAQEIKSIERVTSKKKKKKSNPQAKKRVKLAKRRN